MLGTNFRCLDNLNGIWGFDTSNSLQTTSSEASTFIVRIVLSLLNIRLGDFIYILYEFFMMCEVYAHVTKHSTRVCSCGMCD